MKMLFLHNAFIFMCYNNSYLFLSFHNKLKTNPRYLNHRANRRCDDLIEVLLNIKEDMFFERMRKEDVSYIYFQRYHNWECKMLIVLFKKYKFRWNRAVCTRLHPQLRAKVIL